MLTFPKPLNYVGDQLAQEIQARGHRDVRITEFGDAIEVSGVGEAARADCEAAIAAHVPDPNFGKSQQQRDDEALLEAFEQNANPTDAQTAAAVKALWRRGRS